MGRRSSWLGLVLVGMCGALAAQAPEGVVREGWHVVRPGETLWALAERYLGEEEAWPTLHALNPEIADPHWISPGQRLRVQVTNDNLEDVTQVTKVSRRVEGQLAPHPWLPSIEQDLLKPFDGVRTFESSSSELLFADATRLVMSEDTLVFLGRGAAYERRVRREEIEIVVGQADLDADAEARERDLVLGQGRMTPSAGDDGRSQARLRRPDDGGSQIMIYAGSGAVQSGGATQEVPAGMGTQMEEGEPPSPPEELLPPAVAVSPAAGSEWAGRRPAYEWEPVEGAESYVVEICRDAACGRLVERVDGVEGDELAARELEVGGYFWRVTAVSPSGLDGYPSESTPFAVVSTAADVEGPRIETQVTGGRIFHEGTLFVGPGARLEIAVEDDLSGVESSWATLDGVEVGLEQAAGGWPDGAHLLVVHARDHAGNVSHSKALEFVRDATPPEIHWGREGGGVYHTFVGEGAAGSDWQLAGRSPRRLPRLVWSTDGDDWQAAAGEAWWIEAREAPRFLLRSRSWLRRLRLFAAPGASLGIGRRTGVELLAVDLGVGTDHLEFELIEGAGGARLRVEAVDHFGSRSSVSLPFGRGRGGR